MPTALALSPHLDDAAFSCGGTLARLAASGWRVVVATLFTASVPDPSGFALACQLDKGLGPEVDYMALRRDEDAAAMRALGAEPAWMQFREAPHRGYDSAPALFAGVRDEDGIVDDLAPALSALLAEHRPDLVLAPQCIGGHADHVQAVRAFDRAGWAGPTLWWRDFPYVVRDASPREPLRERMATLPEREVALSPSEAEAKRQACLAYVSQLGFQFGGAEGLERRLAAAGGAECFRVTGNVAGF
ncbi:PIG-L deacetylase family protein [Lichenibacterium dinghuense]|uniref:PIG-L deacetylase family protein n=1 Tax=Lichenibacterium dinghuense TaxID=2895977 RepID=UPI001F2E11C1|nr:PIG-L family deacetylase [Lichenibacterium sp. 6Y81]